MNTEQKRKLNKLIEKAEEDRDLLGIILFGSLVNNSGYDSPSSDLDICLVTENDLGRRDKEMDNLKFSRKRLEYLSIIDPKGIDIQIFGQLPIYIRKRILGEGKIEYCRDKTDLYKLAYRTLKAYRDFEPRLRQYLKGVKNE